MASKKVVDVTDITEEKKVKKNKNVNDDKKINKEKSVNKVTKEKSTNKVKPIKKSRTKKDEKKEIENLADSKEVKVLEVEDLSTKSIPIVEDVKLEKKKRFWDEVKSFFILVIIIVVVILAGWLFIKYAEPIEWKNKNQKEEVKIGNTKDYEVISYVSELKEPSLEVINNKFIIEYSDIYLNKIMDLNLNTLYSAVEDDEVYVFAEGIDNNLYAFTTSEIDDGLILNLYILENKKLVEVKEFSREGVYYTPLYTDNYLIGIVGNYCYLDENLKDACESELFTLDNEESTLKNMYVAGDLILGTESEAPIYSRNSKYVVIKNIVDNKYGLYDLENHELIIKTSYDDLYTTYNNSFVAVKEGKAGIIDKKLKKLVDFKYDFIDINEEYFIVSKDNKLSIMDFNYKLITGAVFPYVNYTDNTLYNGYVYRESLMVLNSFESSKIGDKYILINNVKNQLGYNYIADSVYVIDDKGVYEKIAVESFGVEDLLYSYSMKNGKLVIYDNDLLTEKNVIDLSDYDYDDYPYVELINGNTIVVTMDSELYFDYETGAEIEGVQDTVYNFGDLEIKYNSKNGKVFVNCENSKIVSYNYDPLVNKKPYIELNENDFYFVQDGTFVMVVKR